MRRLTHGTERCGRGALRATALLTLLTALLVAPATAGAAAAGGLKQLAGPTAAPATPPAGGLPRPSAASRNSGRWSCRRTARACTSGSRDKDAIVAFDAEHRDGRADAEARHHRVRHTNATAGTQTDDGCILATANADALDGVTRRRGQPRRRSLYASIAQRPHHGPQARDRRHADVRRRRSTSPAATRIDSFPAVTVAPTARRSTRRAGGLRRDLWMLSREHLRGREPRRPRSTLFNCIAVSACGTKVPEHAATPSRHRRHPGQQAGHHGRGESTGRSSAWTAHDQRRADANAHRRRCVAASTGLANCTTRSGQLYPRGSQSSSNRDIYVGGYYGLSSIQRNATTNTIAPVASADSCFDVRGLWLHGCTDGVSCNVAVPARATVASPDGKNIYMGTDNDGAVLAFEPQHPSGGLQPQSDAARLPARRGRPPAADSRRAPVVRAADDRPDQPQRLRRRRQPAFTFAVDRPPVCQNVSAGTVNTAAVTVALSCSDPDGDAVTYEKLTDPVRGSLAGIQGNTVSYGPQAGTTGVDSFQYRARAAGVASDPATASINVTAPPTGGGGGGGGGGDDAAAPPSRPCPRRRASTRSGSRSTRSS